MSNQIYIIIVNDSSKNIYELPSSLNVYSFKKYLQYIGVFDPDTNIITNSFGVILNNDEENIQKYFRHINIVNEVVIEKCIKFNYY